MRKLLALALACVMGFTVTACASNSGSKKASGSIVVGVITDLDANMMAGWTNSAANNDLRNLMFGYAPVAYTRDSKFVFDKQVVKEHKQTTNDDGTSTFEIKLNSDLKWNDGSKMVAKDFVLPYLLYASPVFAEIEGSDTATYSNCVVGWDDYNAGKTKTFSGVRLIDDQTFSITIKAEELPFHFDIAYLSTPPLPSAVVIKGADITDSGNGATVSDNFNADLLGETIGNTETGYRYMPKVTAGPYQLTEFSLANKQATVTVNPNFKGTYDDVKPMIEKITLKKVVDATQMDELAAGKVDLIAGTSGGDSINAGLDVVEAEKASYASYPRAGYGKIAFSCDFGPTQFAAVRQAITHCLDRETFAKQYTGGFGKLVHGFYGLSMQEYKDNKAEIDKLNQYTYSTDEAEKLLINDGWTLNKDGKDFVKGTDDVRYKMVDGKLMGLIINWANSPDNPVSDLISTMLPSEMAKVGMKLNPTTIEFGVLLQHLYREGIDTPEYNMFNLATGFVPIPSYWYDFSDKDQYMGNYNTWFLKDAEIAKITSEMKAIPSDDTATWNAKWVEMQKRFNELMPEVALYSDEYHDFFNPKIQGYTPTPIGGWTEAILYSTLK